MTITSNLAAPAEWNEVANQEEHVDTEDYAKTTSLRISEYALSRNITWKSPPKHL